MHHCDVLIWAVAHDIVEELETDIPLALVEGDPERISVHRGGEDMGLLELVENVSPASNRRHILCNDFASSLLGVGGVLFQGADGFAVD